MNKLVVNKNITGGVTMRKTRGIQNLIDYLSSINIPVSKYAIETALRKKSIPCSRPTPRLLIFDLDEIDAWISGDQTQ